MLFLILFRTDLKCAKAHDCEGCQHILKFSKDVSQKKVTTYKQLEVSWHRSCHLTEVVLDFKVNSQSFREMTKVTKVAYSHRCSLR